MEKIHLTLEVNKFNKSKIVERKFKNQAGEEVVNKEYKVDVVPLTAEKFVTQGDGWKMFKTHFVVEKKANKDDADVYVGNGFRFENTREDNQVSKQVDSNDGVDEINPSDIPF
jgi:hypothetical protein